MKKITLLAIFLMSSFGFAQQVVVQNFETPSSFNLNSFAGLSGTVLPDPVSGGSRINSLQLTSTSAGEIYQGCEITQLSNKFKLTTDKTIKIDVYSTVAFTLLAKAEGGGSGPNSGASQNYTTPNAWQTLTFTFTQNLDNTATANGSYSSLVLFPNWNPNNAGFLPATNFSVFVDNITSEATPILPPAQPATAAPTPPARPVADVKSLFSNAYAPIAVLNYSGADNQPSNDNTYNTSWSPANTSLLLIFGNDTNKTVGLGFEGVSFLAGRFDATGFTNLHMDIWTDSPTTNKSFNVKFSNWNGGTGEANAIEYAVTNANFLPATNPGTWISLDIPLSSFNGINGSGRNDLAQFIITSDLGTVFYDNLYLHKNTILATSTFETANVRMYPNPANNVLNIEAKTNIENVSIYNLLGQEIISKSVNNSTATLDISNLQVGVYVVKSSIDGKIASSRLIKK